MNHSLVYTEQYFKESHQTSYFENRLRMGDQFMAVCYIFGITHIDIFSYMDFENLSHRDFCWDNHHGHSCLTHQMIFVECQFRDKNYLRKPMSILEIGSGRGEVIAFLNACKERIEGLDYQLQSVDPSPDFQKLYTETCYRLFNKEYEQELLQGTLESSFFKLDLDCVDTVLFVESIEHIDENEFFKFINYARPYFQKNHTRLIIVNAWGFWPIPTNDIDHIWAIDDTVYDKIESLASTTILRSRSHLVVEF